MRPQIWAVFSLVTVCLQSAYSGNPTEIIHYSNENGLSNNSVNCIAEDSRRFIWIGTNDGLNRFDSNNFTVYRNIPGDSTSLPSNDISKLFLDSSGKLWIGTRHGGVCYFEPEKDAFKRLEVKQVNSGTSFSDAVISGIAEDKNRNVWIATLHGINFYNVKLGNIVPFYSEIPTESLLSFVRVNAKQFPSDFEKVIINLSQKNKRVDKYSLTKACIAKYGIEPTNSIINYLTVNLLTNISTGLLDDKISALYSDDEGFIWIGYSKYGFSRFDPRSKTFRHYSSVIKDNRDEALSYTVTSFYKYNGKLYVGYDVGKVHALDLFTGTVTKLVEDSSLAFLHQIELFDENRLWIATATNIMLFDLDKESLMNFSHFYELSKSQLPNQASYLFTDHQKNRWIGTHRTGFFLTYNQKGFSILNTGNILSKDWVSAIREDKDRNIWIGYFTSSMDRISPNFELNKTYEHKKNCAGCFAGESVFCIFNDSKNNLWFGNYLSGLQKYNPDKDNFTVIHHDPKNSNSPPSDDIRAIEEDKHGNLWLACHGGGLCKFDTKNKRFVTFKANNEQWENNLPSNWLIDLHIDNRGIIWISTTNGFCTFDTARKTFQSYRTTNSLLPHNYVTELYIDNHQNIWIGTQGGLAVFDRGSEKLNVLTTKDGLPDNDIKAICEDKKHRFWVTTNLGMFSCQAYLYDKLNLSLLKNTIIKYDVTDGISSNEFHDRASCITVDGKILFGTRNGITMFYPDSILVNTEVPPVYLTDFKIFNKSIKVNQKFHDKVLLRKPIYLTDTIILDYKSNFFSISFTALNFIQSYKNQFKCTLQGFDSEWQDLGNRHEVSYANIPSGTYNLTILASNNEGIWGSNGRTLVIIIKPPLWKTPWFRAFLVALIGLLLIVMNYLRITRTQKLNQLLKNQVEIRTKEIEIKNRELTLQTEKMISANQLLEERQQLIEEQSEELTFQRDELKQLNVTKDKLFAILAHDLKGPFNSIIGFSELLLYNLDKYPTEKVKTHLGLIRDSARITYELMENLLTWARSQRGSIQFTPEEINLSVFIIKIINILKPLAVRKDLTIAELTIVGKERSVLADPDMLSVIVRNLLSNAIKYSNSGGIITIQLGFTETEVQFSIADQGIGIDDDQKEKLFKGNNFVTVEGTSGEKGTGLGILLCSDFIARHHGKFWLESKIDIGTTFYFTIPLSTSQKKT